MVIVIHHRACTILPYIRPIKSWVLWIFRKNQKHSLSLENFLQCTFHNAPLNIIF